MKTKAKLIFNMLFTGVALLSASCEKEGMSIYHDVGYRVTQPEHVTIDTIYYKDAHGTLQYIAKPLGLVNINLSVEGTFQAEMRVVGTINDSAICLIQLSHYLGVDTEANIEEVSAIGPFDVRLNKVIE
jgi:hypothetical protein